MVKKAQTLGYNVTLLFIWLDSPEMAIERVAERVGKGGHDIPKDVIQRRYHRGIFNLIHLYIPVCDSWIVMSTKDVVPELIAKGSARGSAFVLNDYIWSRIVDQSKQNGNEQV